WSRSQTATSSSPSARWTAGRPASRWARRASRSTLCRSRCIQVLFRSETAAADIRSSVPGAAGPGPNSLDGELRQGKTRFVDDRSGSQAREVQREQPVLIGELVDQLHPRGRQVALDPLARELRADLGAQLLAGGEREAQAELADRHALGPHGAQAHLDPLAV